MSSQISRAEVYKILMHWEDFEWQVQGFGMLRTYLDGPGEPRLQVWDQRLATWSNNAIHDHPWAFESTVMAGMLFNQRFGIRRVEEVPFGAFGCVDGYVTEIIPGTRGGQLSERPIVRCLITPYPTEVYSMGESYSQQHREMHLTKYLPGTVTVIIRSEREAEDIAQVAWYGGRTDQPPFVNPYAATREVAATIIGDCLKSWWLEQR